MARDTLGMEFEVHDHILRSTPLEVQTCPLKCILRKVQS